MKNHGKQILRDYHFEKRSNLPAWFVLTAFAVLLIASGFGV